MGAKSVLRGLGLFGVVSSVFVLFVVIVVWLRAVVFVGGFMDSLVGLFPGGVWVERFGF